MSPTTTDIILLTLASGGILLALTIIGEILHARRGDEDSPVLETYMTRVQSWWGIIIIVDGAGTLIVAKCRIGRITHIYSKCLTGFVKHIINDRNIDRG